MEKITIQTLINNFESITHITKDGVEFWLAREIQPLLGYAKRDNFIDVINKAKKSCNNSGKLVSDYFADVGKMVALGSGSEREI